MLLSMVTLGGTALRAEELPVDQERIQRALEKKPALVLPLTAPTVASPSTPAPRLESARQSAARASSDSIWEGLLIGAGIGGAGGYVWARQLCGTDDDECFYLAAPAGIITGAGIGALVGAIADKLHD